MTREEALSKKYCLHCAAYGPTWRCGVFLPVNAPRVCILSADTAERFRREFGLEGVVKRSPSTDAFGDEDQMKKSRGRKAKRYLK